MNSGSAANATLLPSTKQFASTGAYSPLSHIRKGLILIAVIFELWPNSGQEASYFDWAAQLRPQLETVDGFISVERFESLAQAGKFLSLSFWRVESAVQAWRNMSHHRAAQSAGRGSPEGSGVLTNYRLRVAHVMRDYGLHEREQSPQDSQSHHSPQESHQP